MVHTVLQRAVYFEPKSLESISITKNTIFSAPVRLSPHPAWWYI